MEEVEVYVKISGYHCSFDEISINAVYDITNDKKIAFCGWSKEEIDEFEEFDGYTDLTWAKAIKVGDKYYVDLTSV